jgi:hypothetical protein
MFDYLERMEGELDLSGYAYPETGYVRHLIEKTTTFELYCIVWSDGSQTPYHDHPVGGCWMRVVEGELCESTLGGERLLRKGDTGFQRGPYGIHRITALQSSKSLHLYKPCGLIVSRPSETQ